LVSEAAKEEASASGLFFLVVDALSETGGEAEADGDEDGDGDGDGDGDDDEDGKAEEEARRLDEPGADDGVEEEEQEEDDDEEVWSEETGEVEEEVTDALAISVAF